MSGLAGQYREVRAATEELCAPLELEDYVVQPVDDVSPPKWHLGHTTWFFETFLLARYERGYIERHPAYAGVFNSYYRSVGAPYPRAKRGTLSRPTVGEVYAYRHAVDESMARLIAREKSAGFKQALVLGLNHEQQHQELLLCDIKYILAHNPVPADYGGGAFAPARSRGRASALRRVAFKGGVFRLGHQGEGFAFDNEGPAHETLVRPFRLAHRLTTNAEYAGFIKEDGYGEFRHWLSDGWDRARAEGWAAPLHWDESLDPAARSAT